MAETKSFAIRLLTRRASTGLNELQESPAGSLPGAPRLVATEDGDDDAQQQQQQQGWPRTWAASSDWSARVGATSLAESLRRSAFAAGPVAEARIEAAVAAAAAASSGGSPRVGARHSTGSDGVVGARAPGAAAPRRERPRSRLGRRRSGGEGDLEEALLFEHEDGASGEGGSGTVSDSGGSEYGQPSAAAAQLEQQQQQQHEEEIAAHSADGSISFTSSVQPRHSSAAAVDVGGDWEATPLMASAPSAVCSRAEHSYLLTRRPPRPSAGAPATPPALAAAAAATAAAVPPPSPQYREPVLVHVEAAAPTSSTLQTAFNAVNVLCGVGLLTTPYALALSGWAALLLLLLVGGVACATGAMLAACMARAKAARSYPDIGGAAFGTPGRVAVSVLLYLELFACAVDFLILEGDGLAAIAPNASLTVGGVTLSAKATMMLASAAALLPTVLLRDLSLLSYLSVFGIFASIGLVCLVAAGAAWTGLPAAAAIPLAAPRGFATTASIFAFCFSGHAVFPSLYASLRCKRRFGMVLVSSFAVVVTLYGAAAVLGACMFTNSELLDNVALSMERVIPSAPPTRLATYVVVISPATKIALTLAPVAMAIEELVPLPRGGPKGGAARALASSAIRGGLLLAVLAVAVSLPLFGVVMSLIGSLFSMSISIVAPALFYYVLVRPGWPGTLGCVAIGIFGTAVGVWSTADTVRRLFDQV